MYGRVRSVLTEGKTVLEKFKERNEKLQQN